VSDVPDIPAWTWAHGGVGTTRVSLHWALLASLEWVCCPLTIVQIVGRVGFYGNCMLPWSACVTGRSNVTVRTRRLVAVQQSRPKEGSGVPRNRKTASPLSEVPT